MRRVRGGAVVPLVGAILWLGPAGCGGQGAAEEGRDGDGEAEEARDAGQETPNALTDAEREAGWRLLFDGETTEGWRGYRREGMPDGWTVEDGALHRSGAGGDIVTEEQFDDFELSLEWRVGPGGNSGIFYLATEEPDRIYEVALEMQVLDDAGHPDGQSRLTSAGAVYGLYPAPQGVVKSAGEWNRARLRVDDGRVEHWLNGTKVAEYELGSDDWKGRVAESKFTEWAGYGTARRGHIGLQDHGDPVWFRDIKIRELP